MRRRGSIEGGAVEQGDEADEAWSTSELRSLSPVFDRLPAGQRNGSGYGITGRMALLGWPHGAEPCCSLRLRRFQLRSTSPAGCGKRGGRRRAAYDCWEAGPQLCDAWRIRARANGNGDAGQVQGCSFPATELRAECLGSGEFGCATKVRNRHTLSNKWMQQTKPAQAMELRS